MNAMEDASSKNRRRPWVAAVLGFVWPGVGHLYAGRTKQGLLLLVLFPPVELFIYLLAVVIPLARINLVVPLALVLAVRAILARWAARAAATREPGTPLPVSSRWYACVASVVLLYGVNFAYVHAYRTTFVQAFWIPSNGMHPTLQRGDRLLAVKWTYGWHDPLLGHLLFGGRRPARGDLLLFRFPEDRSRVFIKRCIGLPGETVEIRDKQVFIDGRLIDEPYVHFLNLMAPRESWGPALVPPNSYFVLGDGRDTSRDSRHWGFLDQRDLLGRPAVLYWASDPKDHHLRWNRIGMLIH